MGIISQMKTLCLIDSDFSQGLFAEMTEWRICIQEAAAIQAFSHYCHSVPVTGFLSLWGKMLSSSSVPQGDLEL